MFILLVCSAGMSTSMLVTRMEKAAKDRGIECRIEAHPFAAIEGLADEANIIMMGPQVRFQLNNMKKTYAPKPVVLIDPRDYGMMNGEKVLTQALEILGK